MIPLSSRTRIWLVTGIIDMRNGFNDLTAKMQVTLKDDPMSDHVSTSCGRNDSQVRLFWSTDDRLCPLTKQLERGHFAWPSAWDDKVFLISAQLVMLLEDIDWQQSKRLLTLLTMLQASLSWSALNEPDNILGVSSLFPDDIDKLKRLLVRQEALNRTFLEGLNERECEMNHLQAQPDELRQTDFGSHSEEVSRRITQMEADFK